MSTGVLTALSSDPAADQTRIDLLVDGELAGDARAALLRSLDATPDGWKRCALAFLEAQAWRQAVCSPVAEAPESRRQPARHAGERWAGRGVLAWAAVVAIAFGVGAMSGASWRPREAGVMATKGEGRTASSDQPVARAAPRITAPRPTVAAGGEVAHVALPAHPSVKVPVITAADVDPQERLRRPSVLPEYLRRQLERQGYEIAGGRELLSVPLADGRTVTIPVETVKYRYVGYRVH
jgi:hypothetical protein